MIITLDDIITMAKLFVLSFTIVYGLWYLGTAIELICGYAYGLYEWAWDDE
jgi:hypothetical protein